MSDLTELFSRDPLSLTEENIDQIITAMREKRHLFKSAPAKTSRSTPKLTDAQAAAVKLDLDFKL